jgi:drug/metabolite transporter (DMT)-like permease
LTQSVLASAHTTLFSSEARKATRMKLSHLILLLLMNLLWGGVYSAYKLLGETLPTGALVTLRFGIAGLSLLAVWPWLPGPAPRSWDLLKTALMGLMLYVLGQRLQVYGNHLGTAGNSAVLIALEPVVVSVAAAVFLRERIGPRRLAGFALGLIGVAVLNGVWRKDFQWTSLAASVIFVSSFICEALYTVIGKGIVTRSSVMKMLAISLLVGTAANLLIDGRQTFAQAKTLDLPGWIFLLALSLLCTAVGYTVWFVVIKDCPVNVAVLTVFAQSVFGVVLAALWIGETLHWDHLFGSLTILAGLVLGLSRQIKRPEAEVTVSNRLEPGQQ